MLISNRSPWSFISPILIFLIDPTSAFSGIKELPGLNIQGIATELCGPGAAALPSPSEYLDELLATCQFHGVHILYDLKTSFKEDESNNSEMTDTDLESMDMEAKTKDKDEKNSNENFISFALNSLNENDSKKEYLLRENEVNIVEGSHIENIKNLCSRLAQDAFQYC
jgi:hypothetical protein